MENRVNEQWADMIIIDFTKINVSAKKFAETVYSQLKDGRHLYVFVGNEYQVSGLVIQALKKVGFYVKNVLVWKYKSNTSDNDNFSYQKSYESVIYAIKDIRKIKNPNQKNRRLIEIDGIRRHQDIFYFEPRKDGVIPKQFIEFLISKSSQEGEMVSRLYL